MTKTSTRESGFTLLELLLVIGVAALLLIGGIATYRMVSEGNRTTDATRLLLSIRQQAQTMAQQQGGVYTSLTYNSASNSAATNVYVVTGVLTTAQKNPFGGNIDISVTAASQLQVQFLSVPKAACVRMVQAVNNPNDLISVGATTGVYTAAANQIPVTVANALATCSAATNTVTWIFP